ncbi:MAG: PD-(D/E)XK nuclease family protein [Patescibacteria group bacterium]
MSKFYNPQRKRNLFDPESKVPYRISRSKIDLFLNCPRCFYLDRRLGVGQPPGFPFSLNAAVDKLLKKEFDIHRAKGEPHPLMKAYGLDLIPLQHEKMDEWRDALRGGIQYLHPKTNLLITGGIDDVWVGSDGELSIVDYKATSKSEEVNLDADWQIGYKRQMEIYQWLFRKNGFKVSDIGYFVYCNGDADKDAFDGKLEFNVKILPYEGNDKWIEQAILDTYHCLTQNTLPKSSSECDFCSYNASVRDVVKDY